MAYENESQKGKSEESIKGLIESNSIVFTADITNEEALILQSIKEKYGKSLICPEAKAYQNFLHAYSSSSGYHIVKGDLETLNASDVVISFGVWFQDERTDSIDAVRSALEMKTPTFVYMHPIEDISLQNSISQFIKYEVGSEEGVAALLAYTLLEGKAFSEEIEEILDELDIGYLSAESNVGEEELESMYGLIDSESSVSLIIGSDLYTHPKADQIAKLIGVLEVYAGVNVVSLPPAKNALGVALICQLDEMDEGDHSTYHTSKEGTYVDANKCLYFDDPRELSALENLNKLGGILGLHAEKLSEYLNLLPTDQGFQKVSEADVNKECIQKLIPQAENKAFVLDEIEDLPVYDGALIYTYHIEKPAESESQKPEILYGSKQFSMATKLQDGDFISYEIEGLKFERVFKIDTHMKGVIALNPVFDIKLSAYLLSSYRFSRLAFEKINNQNIGNNDE